MTSPGKLFRVCAAATGNARSPTVDRRMQATYCHRYHWSFRKAGRVGTLTSQAEIGVWFQAPGAFLRESGGITFRKNLRLYMQNTAI